MIHSTTLFSYVETMLWSSTDTTNDEMEPFDENHSYSDLSVEAIKRCETDLVSFFDQASALLGDSFDELDAGRVAHDFWLTRNDHGAGFWDGDYQDEIGETLTTLSKSFGSIDPYISDSGEIELA